MCTLLYILVCKEAVLLRHWQLLFIEHGVSPTFKCTFHYYYYYSANLALFLEPRLGVDRLLVVPWDGCLVPRLKPGRDVDTTSTRSRTRLSGGRCLDRIGTHYERLQTGRMDENLRIAFHKHEGNLQFVLMLFNVLQQLVVA